MRIPLGDWLRKIVNPNSWLGRVLRLTKGESVTFRGLEIGLDENPTIGSRPGARFEKPSRPKPIR